MVLRPVQRRTKRYIEIAEHLRALIQNGEFAPGSKLPSERELSRRLNVGRSSVREALTALQGMGLIEVRQGFGARVLAPFTAETNEPRFVRADHSERELLEARGAIECANAQFAAVRATRHDLAALAALLSTMEDEERQGEFGAETNLRFHLAIAGAAHNRVLYQLTADMTACSGQTLSPDQRPHLLDQHRRLFRAIAAGDAASAGQIMADHLQCIRHGGDQPYANLHRQPIDHLKEVRIAAELPSIT